MSANAPWLVLLGLGGSLLHVVNHAFFKGLLFLGAGSVLHGAHTRTMELLGGLLKRMPWTGGTFLVGAVAISGLPPLNGFVSELFIYVGAYQGVVKESVTTGVCGLAVIAASYGLGTSLVSGEQAAHTYRVDREGRILDRVIAEKRFAHRAAPECAGGLQRVEISPEEADGAALTDDEVRAVAALARRVGHLFGRPQDIEWAIQDGGLYLLQARPITALSEGGDPDGVRCLWDNSNIVESYAGVTSALTFSFARRAYEEVYRQFCRLMHVPAAKIAAHDGTFRCMLGLIGGRVFYNLLSWFAGGGCGNRQTAAD